MPWMAEGRALPGGSFELAGRMFSPNWLQYSTPEERAEYGISWEPDPPAPAPPPKTPAELIAYSAAKRWMVETGGIVSGTYGPIRTDERTQVVLTVGWAKATADPNYQITDWKTPTPGAYVTLPGAAIIAIANLVEAHVQACFSANKLVDEAILADPPTITTTAEIDAAAWPANT